MDERVFQELKKDLTGNIFKKLSRADSFHQNIQGGSINFLNKAF